MLMINPNFSNSFNRTPAFGKSDFQRYAEDIDYTDYDDVPDSYERCSETRKHCFDIESEKAEARQELDLWEQAKANVEAITKTTEMVPAIKTGTKILTGLTTIAIGWGGLRWGTVGTLELLSKIGKSKAAKTVSGKAAEAGNFLEGKYGSLKTRVVDSNLYKKSSDKLQNWKTAFLNSGTGELLTECKDLVKNNSVYQKILNSKNSVVNYVKNMNGKRVFVETMGIAGGANATVNLLSGKTIDGVRNNVEVDKNGNYTVNGVVIDEGGLFDAA